jgi:hypothetical protein
VPSEQEGAAKLTAKENSEDVAENWNFWETSVGAEDFVPLMTLRTRILLSEMTTAAAVTPEAGAINSFKTAPRFGSFYTNVKIRARSKQINSRKTLSSTRSL